jgi:hypothetical protein
LNALLDAGNFFHQMTQSKEQVRRQLTSPFVIDLIQTIGKYGQQQENKECHIYACEVRYQFLMAASQILVFFHCSTIATGLNLKKIYRVSYADLVCWVPYYIK